MLQYERNWRTEVLGNDFKPEIEEAADRFRYDHGTHLAPPIVVVVLLFPGFVLTRS